MRTNHVNLHVHGFRKEGTTTTPFDMVVMKMLDRYHLVLNAISRVKSLAGKVHELAASLDKKLTEHTIYVREHGEDMPKIQKWSWPYKTFAEAGD